MESRPPRSESCQRGALFEYPESRSVFCHFVLTGAGSFDRIGVGSLVLLGADDLLAGGVLPRGGVVFLPRVDWDSLFSSFAACIQQSLK